MGVAYNSRIVTDGLVLCLDAGNSKSYPGSGTTWYDLSGTGNSGTLENGVGYSGSNLGSLVFDGVNDYIIFPNFDGFTGGDNPFSFSFWFYSDASASDNPEAPFFYGNETTGQAIRIRLNNNGVITSGHWGGSGYDWNTNSGAWTLSAWNCLAETYDGTTDRLYINGLEVGNSNINNLSIPTSSNLILGKRPSGEIYGGQISQVSIYNRALTAQEIQQNFNATKSRYFS